MHLPAGGKLNAFSPHATCHSSLVSLNDIKAFTTFMQLQHTRCDFGFPAFTKDLFSEAIQQFSYCLRPFHRSAPILPYHSLPFSYTMISDSTSIQVSCQQTRFHIAEGAENREVAALADTNEEDVLTVTD